MATATENVLPIPGFNPPSEKPQAPSSFTSANSSPMASLTPGAVTDEGTPPNGTETPAAIIKKPNFTPIENKKQVIEGWNGIAWSSEDVSTSCCILKPRNNAKFPSTYFLVFLSNLQDKRLKQLVSAKKKGSKKSSTGISNIDWEKVASSFGAQHGATQCKERFAFLQTSQTGKGPWSQAEDKKIVSMVSMYGTSHLDILSIF
jgi:hypothetical protein